MSCLNKRNNRFETKDGEFYHYDTPCTIDNELNMFREAGFKNSLVRWRGGNTTIVENIK